MRNSRCQLSLIYSTVTDHHYFVEKAGILFHNNVELACGCNLFACRVISDIREVQLCPGRNLDNIIAVDIRRDTYRTLTSYDRNSYQRLTVLIGDRAVNFQFCFF